MSQIKTDFVSSRDKIFLVPILAQQIPKIVQFIDLQKNKILVQENPMDLKKLVRDVPDFPKSGILFRDVSPLLKDPKALNHVVENLVLAEAMAQIELIAGIESRGFLLAGLLAAHYKKGLLLLRKAGKLPPPVERVSYALEYGEATLEVNPGRGRILIVDDVLATGGTLQAALDLAQKAGYEVVDISVLVDLPALNEFRFKGKKIRSLIQY